MISLEVVSLFSNVPISETIRHIGEYIRDNEISIRIPMDKLNHLNFMYTKNVQFQLVVTTPAVGRGGNRVTTETIVC